MRKKILLKQKTFLCFESFQKISWRKFFQNEDFSSFWGKFLFEDIFPRQRLFFDNFLKKSLCFRGSFFWKEEKSSLWKNFLSKEFLYKKILKCTFIESITLLQISGWCISQSHEIKSSIWSLETYLIKVFKWENIWFCPQKAIGWEILF